jgi:hypothetical protein
MFDRDYEWTMRVRVYGEGDFTQVCLAPDPLTAGDKAREMIAAKHHLRGLRSVACPEPPYNDTYRHCFAHYTP